MEFVLISGAQTGARIWEPRTHGLRTLGHRGYPITLYALSDGDVDVLEVGLQIHVDDALSVLKAEDLRTPS